MSETLAQNYQALAAQFGSPGAKAAREAQRKLAARLEIKRAQKAYNERSSERDRYLAAIDRQMAMADQDVLDQENQNRKNLEAIDTRTAQSFALSIDPNMTGGGGNTAAMADLAQTAALSRIEQQQRNQNLLRQVRNQQATVQKQGYQDRAAAGTRESDYQTAYTQGLADIQNAMGKLFPSDKKRGVRAAIAAAQGTSPEAAMKLREMYSEYA